MQASHEQNMNEISTGFLGWFITIILIFMSHIFTVANLQGLAAFTATLYGGFNLFYLIKKNSKK
jgi:hypothetical protein